MDSVAVLAPRVQTCMHAASTIQAVLDVPRYMSRVSGRAGKLRTRRCTDRCYEPTDGLDIDAVQSNAVTLAWSRYDRAGTRQQQDGGNEVSSGSPSVLATSGLRRCRELARDLHGATPCPSATPHHEYVRFATQGIRGSLDSQLSRQAHGRTRVDSIEAPVADA